MLAARGGHLEVVEMLASAGLDAKSAHGFTALYFAAQAGHERCAAALCRAGAKGLCDAGGLTPGPH